MPEVWCQKYEAVAQMCKSWMRKMTVVNRRRPSGLYDTREDAKEESGVMNKSRVEAEPDRLHALPHLTLRERYSSRDHGWRALSDGACRGRQGLAE